MPPQERPDSPAVLLILVPSPTLLAMVLQWVHYKYSMSSQPS